MLSIHAKKGTTTEHVAKVADYPDESLADKLGHSTRPDRSSGAVEDYYSQNNGGNAERMGRCRGRGVGPGGPFPYSARKCWHCSRAFTPHRGMTFSRTPARIAVMGMI